MKYFTNFLENNSTNKYDEEFGNKKNEITIKYKLGNESENEDIRLFGSKFYHKNIQKGIKLIISGEEMKLIESYKIPEFLKDDKLIVKFIFKENLTDLSYMFANCSALLSISNISNLINKNVNI